MGQRTIGIDLAIAAIMSPASSTTDARTQSRSASA
jgi:hypothetical protein